MAKVSSSVYRPVVLVVYDGFGVAPASRGNAISLAKTPHFDDILRHYPAITLQASGEAVGSLWGELGNSEVGHMNMGAGRIVYQDLPRITKAVADGSIMKNPALLDAVKHVKEKGSSLHIMGLMSSGGVHSFNEHAYALLEFAKHEKIDKVFIHAFLDGRDTPHNSAERFITKLQATIQSLGVGKIASLSGRYWAMDRDNRWDRIEKAYRVLVDGNAEQSATDPMQAIHDSYAKKVYDEEFIPTVITDAAGAPIGKINNNDAVIFFNFRPDRARQLTKAFVLPGFEKFSRVYMPDLFFVTMTEYEKDLPVSIAFPPEHVAEPLAKVLSDAGKTQLHIAETEKYAHVTFFFNGGREKAYPQEDRILIPSPAVNSYDQKPDMSAREITDRVIEEIQSMKYDLIVINYANADMVGHTGKLPATIEAIEMLDEMTARLKEIVEEVNGVLLLTADHGNAEDMINLQTGFLQKEHTTNPVPCILVGKAFRSTKDKDTMSLDLSLQTPRGLLSDVAPTILELMGVAKPKSMTGKSLLHVF
ncbi:MAG: 2,3-bisphosphoglycerate-independent phosphoglycerate mutase [Candidatus Nomurabacteria bacterium]|nr:MAG: 2,3-bisphosphoglycerate-independent phosphoglycerate mutase [Candidatus Nomurabacteria bacterium]